MISNNAVMTNVVTAPHNHIVSDAGERLYRVVFQDEAIIPYRCFREYRCPGADIADQLVSSCLDLIIYGLPQPVHSPMRHGSKEGKLRRLVNIGCVFKWNDRQPFKKPVCRQVLLSHTECDN